MKKETELKVLELSAEPSTGTNSLHVNIQGNNSIITYKARFGALGSLVLFRFGALAPLGGT